MIKVNGMKIETVDYEYAVKFADDADPLICEHEDDALAAYKTARDFDASPELLRRVIFVTGWHRPDDEFVAA